MKKIAVSSIVSLFVLSCSVPVTNISTQDTSSSLIGRMPHRDFRWSQYAPTGQSSLVRDTSSPSPQTPLLGGAGVGSLHPSLIKYNFAELEKEYKSFKTKALADTYVKKMFNKFLIVTPNSVQVIRQVEFSRYLKNNGDTSYETSLKNIFTDTPVLYSSLTGMAAVQSKMTSESGTFGFYILGVSPNQTVPTALPATNITETSFTANWSAVTGATSYTLIVDGVEIPGITGTNHTLNSLTAGSNHKYRVKAITSGVAGAASNEINVNTILTAPTANAASGVGHDSLIANWSAVTGATSYTLTVNGTEYTGLTGTSKELTGLLSNTFYSYHVKAVNGVTESVNSLIVNISTLSEAQAFITIAGITDTTQQNAIIALVSDLKTAGIWTKMKAIYPFVGGTSTSHKFNLKNPKDTDGTFRLTFDGGWTHTATGALPDGSSGYANTHLNASSNLITNDTHMSYYSMTEDAIDVDEMGCYDSTSRTLFGIEGGGTGIFDGRLNTTSGAVPTITYTGNSKAFFIQNKHNSSTVEGYRDSVLFGSVATTNAGPSNCELYIGARKGIGGIAEHFSNRETAFATIGDGLTNTEALSLYNSVKTFETTLGREVN